eukprot:TRINITY_DN37733_c0_g2_i1.p1 TRINITY_DN37733_c0_g2~~TRINITY_DN37733_c0_g2_i1.p1  ORF type:complete len:201 (+),score=37.74 TRINITY_DN37733_c0_g2_i1:239-841(+)
MSSCYDFLPFRSSDRDQYRNSRTGITVPTGFADWSESKKQSFVHQQRLNRRDQSLLGRDCPRRKRQQETLDGVEDAPDGQGQVWVDGEERVYQCLIPPPGVGYRNSANFDDKHGDGCGPQKPEVVTVDRIWQGPQAVFVRDSRNMKWLPLTDPRGSRTILQLIGKKEDADMIQFAGQLNQGEVKSPKKSGWFSKTPAESP